MIERCESSEIGDNLRYKYCSRRGRVDTESHLHLLQLCPRLFEILFDYLPEIFILVLQLVVLCGRVRCAYTANLLLNYDIMP